MYRWQHWRKRALMAEGLLEEARKLTDELSSYEARAMNAVRRSTIAVEQGKVALDLAVLRIDDLTEQRDRAVKIIWDLWGERD